MKKRFIAFSLLDLFLVGCGVTGTSPSDRALYPFSDFELVIPFKCSESYQTTTDFVYFTPEPSLSLDEIKTQLEDNDYYVEKRTYDNNCHQMGDDEHKLNEVLIVGYEDEIKSFIECFVLCNKNDELQYGAHSLYLYYNDKCSIPYPNYLFTRIFGKVESHDDEMYKYGFEHEGNVLDGDYYGYYDLTIDGTFEDLANFYKHSLVENLQIDYENNSLKYEFQDNKIKMFFFEHEGKNYIGTKLI